MKILHIINGYANPLYCLLLKKLEQYIDYQTVFFPIRNINNKGANFIRSDKINIVYELVATNILYRIFFNLKIKKSLKKISSSIKNIDTYNLTHAHTLFSDGTIAYKLKKDYKIPYIVTIRNTDINIFFKYLFFLRKYGVKILLDSSTIIFLSESYKNKLLKEYIPLKFLKVIESKSIIITNGINDFWHKNNSSAHKKISNTVNLLYVGSICRNKNILGVVNAVKSLNNNGVNIKYTIVGEGKEDEKDYLKIIKQRTKNYPNIKIIKALPKEKLIEYYREAHIFIMPSFTESFGLVYAEALSQGLPIIYSKNEGFDKVFKNGYIGYSCNPKDYINIAESIISIINNYSEIQKRCSESSKEFSWNKIALKYNYIYKLIKNKSN